MEPKYHKFLAKQKFIVFENIHILLYMLYRIFIYVQNIFYYTW